MESSHWGDGFTPGVEMEEVEDEALKEPEPPSLTTTNNSGQIKENHTLFILHLLHLHYPQLLLSCCRKQAALLPPLPLLPHTPHTLCTMWLSIYSFTFLGLFLRCPSPLRRSLGSSL